MDILATPEGFKRPKGFERGVNNSPSEYLLDVDKSLENTTATLQIGNVLYERNYLSTVTTYDSVVAGADARPTVPGRGYTFNDGQWMWIPDYMDAANGTWYWILRSKSYYESLFHSIINIISRAKGRRLTT